MKSRRKALAELVILSCGLLGALLYDEKNSYTELTFSKGSGFYEESFELELYAPAGTEIYYTLDGSDPDENAIKYTDPIYIGEATGNDNIYSMRTDVSAGFLEDSQYVAPDYNVDKCTVVRAVYRDADGNYSDIKTESYFIGYGDKHEYEGLNVISIVTDPDNLFDYDKGIYVLGRTYDEYKNTGEIGPWWWHWSANYNQHGLEWEREADIQIFSKDKELLLNQGCGIRIQGGGSRGLLPKNINLYARKEYDQNSRFYLDLFNTEYMADAVTLFAGSDDYISKLKDKLAAELVKERAVVTMNFVPFAMFLDGEYWGLYWLTEKYNDTFLSYYYDVKKDNVVMIKNYKLAEGDEKGYDLYKNMIENIYYTDFIVQQGQYGYEYVSQLIDMQSFMDYFAIEIYLARYNDWPGGNEGLWRTYEIKDGEYEDGKWRWMLYDVNSGGISAELSDVDTFQVTMQNANGGGMIFAHLCESDEFKKQFAITFMDIANTCFTKERVETIISDYLNLMTEPTLLHLKRFRGTEDVEQFLSAVADIQSFFDNRRQYIVQYLKEDFGLTGNLVAVEIETNDAAAGSVKINTAKITFNNNNWTGEYYTDYPIMLDAVANKGYRFVRWEQNGFVSDENNIEINLDEDGTLIKAVFEKIN